MRAKKTGLTVSAVTTLLALTLGLASVAGASTTYGVKSGAWSKRFEYNSCQMRVRWGTENATGVARARFYTRSLSHCSSAVRGGAGPEWMGAVSGASGDLTVVMPGARLPGTHTDACGSYVEWKASLAKITGIQLNLLNSGRLLNPFFRVAASGRSLPSAHTC